MYVCTTQRGSTNEHAHLGTLMQNILFLKLSSEHPVYGLCHGHKVYSLTLKVSLLDAEGGSIERNSYT